MPQVRFQPSKKSVIVPAGTHLLDAAKLAGLSLEAPCGGEGVCGRCAVKVLSGKFDIRGRDWKQDAPEKEGLALACRAWVGEDPLEVMVLDEEESLRAASQEALRGASLVEPGLLPRSGQLKPQLEKVCLKVESLRSGEPVADLDRLSAALEKVLGEIGLSCPLAVLRQVSGALRQEGGRITATLLRQGTACRLVNVEPGDRTARHFGLAVDVGTFSVAVQLVDLHAFKIEATASDYNSQSDYGLDVTARINYARRPERLEELRLKVLDTVNSLIGQAATAGKCAREEISEAVVSGNPAMIHLLLGLNPEYLRLEPGAPTLLQAPGLTAGEIGLDILPQGRVGLSPAVGSSVGGDITAGLLCTPLASAPKGTILYLDIGANGVVAAGNEDRLLACACSSGPAFKGPGLDSSMRAATGAIEEVEVDPETGRPNLWIIGGGKPRGICGSGIISAVASLFLSGWLDAAGKLNRRRPSPSIVADKNEAAFLLAPMEESATGKALYLSEADIEKVIRAKAAVYSAFSLLLSRLGVEAGALEGIYVVGAFGRYLDLEKCVTIGLLPDVDRGKFHFLGNASLEGSRLALISQEYRRRQAELAGRMECLDLNNEKAYMEQYTGALFLPHTDTARFPSVKKI